MPIFIKSENSVGYFALFCLLLIMVPGVAHSIEVSEVRVNNFPETQRIKGEVSLQGTTKAVKREGVLLSPSKRNELSELTHAGKIDTDGFTSVSVYLQGEIKSSSFSSGSIGVIMLPDEEPIVRALKESRQIQFPIETTCTIKSDDSEYFSCSQINQTIGFTRYRIFFYNTLNKPAEVNAYFYLVK